MKNKKIVKIISGLSSVLFCNSGAKTSADLKDFFYISKIIKAIGGLLSDVSIMSRNLKVGMKNLEGGNVCHFRRDLSPLTFINPAGNSFFDVVSSRVIGTEKQIEVLKELGTVYVSKKMAMETGRYVHGNNNIGILMSGPSGCGKTLLATIFAHTLVADGFNEDGTINKDCKSVYRLSSATIDISSREPVWSQLLSEKRMAQKDAAIANNPFKAYLQANPNGGVIIFDEIDKLFDDGNGKVSAAVSKSLVEGFRNIIEHGKIDLDGMTYEMSNYVFIFTTNASESSINKAPSPDLLTPEEERYGYVRCLLDVSWLNRLVLIGFQPLSASALYSIFYDHIEFWNSSYKNSGIELNVPVEVAAQIGIYLKETYKGGREAGNLFDTLIPYLSLIELSMGNIPEEERKDIVLEVGFNKEKGKCFISNILKDGVPLNINKNRKNNLSDINKDDNKEQDTLVKKSKNQSTDSNSNSNKIPDIFEQKN